MAVDVSLAPKEGLSATSDTLVAFDFEGAQGVDKFFGRSGAAEQVRAVVASGDFTGKDSQLSVIYTFGSAKPARILLVGLGKKELFHLNKVRVAAAQAVNCARQLGVEELVFPVSGKHLGMAEQDIVSAIAESSILAQHKFDVNKSDKPPVKLKRVMVSVSESGAGLLKPALESAVLVANNVCRARDLINTPGSVATPEYIASLAMDIFRKRADVRVAVHDRKALQRMGANGILAVASGSDNEPRMVVLEYSPRAARKSYALVGKGITFDSGGLDIKPAQAMETMKQDMSGASAVLYTVLSVADLKLPVRVVGIMALTENMPGSNAYKPGDIVKTMSGRTIEVLNTDAEGRVVLSDALHYAKSFKTDYIVDIATLTGACFVALGSEAAGLVGSDAGLISKLRAAADRSFERVWELPFYPEYQEYIKSDFADIKNVVSNSVSGGGAVTAARFLANFVEGAKWAHLDIAGTAWSDAEAGYKPRGATGFGVRLFVELLKSESG